MDFIDPRNFSAGKHTQNTIWIKDTIAERYTKSHGFPCNCILSIHTIRIQNILDLINQFPIKTLIGIEIKDPIRLRLLQGKIALCGKIIRPSTERDFGTMCLCQFDCLIRAAGIDDDDLIRALLGILYY